MIVNKQAIRRARYDVPPGIDETIRHTLAALPATRAAARRAPLRVVLPAACAIVALCAVAVTAVPSARAYAEGVIRSVFKLYAGQPGNGLTADPTRAAAGSPAPSAGPSAAGQGIADKFQVVASHSVAVNVSQTAGGVKATVLEAAIVDNKLFLGLSFDNLPKYCFPAEEILHITLDGQALRLGSLRHSSTVGSVEVFSVEAPLPMAQEKLSKHFTVTVAFSLRQFPDGGLGKGTVIANFAMSFPMDRPAAFATLPPEPAKEKPGDGPAVTGAPQQEGLDPFKDQNLSEPTGVEEWSTYDNSRAGVSFEYPKGWMEEGGAKALPGFNGAGALLAAYRGAGGSIQIYGVALSGNKLVDAEDFTAANLLTEAATGTEYAVKGGQVFFLFDNSGETDDSCIMIQLDKPLESGGKAYRFLFIWAAKDYNTHILRSLTLGGAGN